jgi:SHS family lactate transporter-like MFS transporter
VSQPTPGKSNRNAAIAVGAAFLGWTIDAFDFFVLVFTLSAIAAEFSVSIPQMALTITASLVARPVGAFLFGLLADRYGRRPLLVANVVFYTVMEVASGLAPGYRTFFAMRLLYGIGMGGNWGVGASLALESVPSRWRGFASGLLQEGYAAGNLLASVAYFALFPHYGWRAMFLIGALPAIPTVLLCLRVEEPEAWRKARVVDWSLYRKAVLQHTRLFLYLVLMMTAMAFIAHGSQDMYPTFLSRERHFGIKLTALITGISTIGAICGGLLGGHLSNRLGRRRTVVLAALLAATVIPLWIAADIRMIVIGAVAMQFLVQAAWGVVPAHMTELSPANLRAFFPGLAYQCGVVISSSVVYLEAVLGEHFTYTFSMGIVALAVLLLGAAVVWTGPEAKGASFD